MTRIPNLNIRIAREIGLRHGEQVEWRDGQSSTIHMPPERRSGWVQFLYNNEPPKTAYQLGIQLGYGRGNNLEHIGVIREGQWIPIAQLRRNYEAQEEARATSVPLPPAEEPIAVATPMTIKQRVLRMLQDTKEDIGNGELDLALFRIRRIEELLA